MFAVEAHSRKLAVILHADVVGSTTLVQRDEAVAHRRITDAFSRLSRIVERYGGIVHEIRGDALVAEFARASDAACASLAFQSRNAEHIKALDADIRPVLRIGIALGEVVVADGTITGSGVVIAQRLEQLADAGGICLQSAVHEAVPRRFPFGYQSLGEQRLKGFDESVRAYRLTLDDGESLPEPEPGQSKARVRVVSVPLALGAGVAAVLIALLVFLAARPWTGEMERVPQEDVARTREASLSIAVLPFDNLSNDPDQEYFSDGLSDDLITDLSRISSLLVIARNSTFAYKGRSVNVQEVGRELGARYVLEGSVRRSDGRVRINAQLIDVSTGAHVWSERYDRDLTDVFALQDEVTATIVRALAVNLTREDRQRRERRARISPDAYDLLLRGNEFLQRYTIEDVAQARRLYEKAIALDSRYARAHANLAFTHALDLIFGWSSDRAESIRRSTVAIEEALALDDRIPQAHFALSNVLVPQNRMEEAIAATRRAIDVDPNYADGYAQLTGNLTYAGRHAEALEAMATAMRLNPRYSAVYLWMQGRALFLLGRFPQAVASLEEAVRRNPEFDQSRLVLAATYAEMGRQEDAEWEAEEIVTRRPDFSVAAERSEKPFQRAEDMERYIGGLLKAGLPR